MSRTPLVTCLIVTYNYARFVVRAVESALAQEYPADSLQIVVVDDGSTDETATVLKPYLDRITYIQKSNGGVISATNRGLAEAKGDFIAFLSGDDLWPADRITRDVEFLIDHPDVGIIYGDMEMIDSEDRTTHRSFRSQFNRKPYRGKLFGTLLSHSVVSGGAMMIRRSLTECFYPIPDDMPSEDWWIALRVAEVAKIEASDRIVYRYRNHGQNMNLGSQGEKLANLMRLEVPLRRFFLSRVALGQATTVELLNAYFRFETSAAQAANYLKIPLEQIVEVTPEERERSAQLLSRGVSALDRNTPEEATLLLVNALAQDPWNQAARTTLHMAMKKLGASFKPFQTAQDPFWVPPSDPKSVAMRDTLEQLSSFDVLKEIRSWEYQDRVRRLTDRPTPRLIARKLQDGPLHVVYVMAHVGVTGGAKVIFEHAEYLCRTGTQVTILCHYPKPDWFPINCEYLQVPFQIELAQCIPACDVIVATYWDHVQACAETGIAPVVYFEQGDFHLYDDVEPGLKEIVRRQFQAATFVTTVSYQAAEHIKSRYGREGFVFHNALNKEVFYGRTGTSSPAVKPYLMMMGSDRVSFKGTDDILKAYELVKRAGIDLDLVWVSPQPLLNPTGRVYVRPSQEVLGELYRGASVFVSGSKYESFPLPPLEAMSCGCPVVTTANVGVLEYASDQDNCLLAEIGNPESLAGQIIRVMEDKVLRDQLTAGGYRTASQFDWGILAENLHNFYKYVSGLQLTPRTKVSDWTVHVDPERFLNREGYNQLTRIMQHSGVDRILVPAVSESFENHFVARWKVAASRKNPGGDAVYRLYSPISWVDERVPYENALKEFRHGHFAPALDDFVKLHQAAENDGDKNIYLKWVILCMIELGMDDKAMELAQNGIKNYPFNTDLAYLYGMLLKLQGQQEGIGQVLARIQTIGESAYLPEFFYGLREIAIARLKA